MARRPVFTGARLVDTTDELTLRCDVLVVGGGPAAAWATLAATETGASVVVVDKGYLGASGVAATAGVGHWLVPPVAERRDDEIGRREETGRFLTDRVWADAILDEAWERTALIEEWGFRSSQPARRERGPFAGRPGERSFSGPAPDYLRFLRGRVKKAGAVVLDHSPAIELLSDASGQASGAKGYQRQLGRPWTVYASAVVLATGGTTWQSHSLGGDVNTGDGHLMAAELGARLSSMEFSNFYGMVPFGTSMDKNGFFISASYWDHRGRPIEYHDLHRSRAELLGASLRGTVTARFAQFGPDMWPVLRDAMPNFFMVTDKLGIDPFTERFPIDWVQEGTVRGTGGIRLVDRDAATGVPGLYAAGDVTARDRLVGAATGAGGPNLAWAVATGTWAGRAAARYAVGRGVELGDVAPAGTKGVLDGARHRYDEGIDDVAEAVRGEILPIDKAVFRSDDGLRRSISLLDGLWERHTLTPATPGEALRARETAAMLAMGRWAVHSALARTETRGMHTRVDHPAEDQTQRHRLLSGGLDEVWVRPDPESPRVRADAAVRVAS
ncbi:FAD-binding protein [Rhodococcus sp. HNM0569]|uniref:FAD-binding protein n=1 Tax=Rhodococcus sp. HNM0569 TaxID=2716340 RepID=UPI00146B6A74|nr:FAD-binding protein [Rhodococcus sp. HNM0569]NLU84387.1 FAD-binding protein [Rhodococcus sp. HNM0569]